MLFFDIIVRKGSEYFFNFMIKSDYEERRSRREDRRQRQEYEEVSSSRVCIFCYCQFEIIYCIL